MYLPTVDIRLHLVKYLRHLVNVVFGRPQSILHIWASFTREALPFLALPNVTYQGPC